ncbi:ABC transporter substrate-binding protein [Brevibacillus ruminantium]|uniref:ABC transporter substrate-binding protein n=1 Tax=Brevibacillus ruminantium TaxID=2950604 RepID=A0ABY4WM57_9BACL|nr:ABC transporter substrate-binding protein [Brevibacillus ruminantium]USG65696.1 ABC transporter substrate-binding protein [Brevibacillus ruminantium]
MQLAEYYLRLRTALADVSEGEETTVTLAQLTDIFVCTNRNCQILLQKLVGAGWITWIPGRGRGNRSLLSFLASRESILLQVGQHLVDKGEMKEAISFVETYAVSSWEKARFHEWLGKQFGYQPLFINNQRVEKLRLFFPYPFFCLDPAQIQYSFQRHIVKQLFDGLVRYDSEKQRMEPALAHYWDVSHDGRIWRFFLRKGVFFHHGKEMNARDAAYTLLRLRQLSETIPDLWMFKQIGTVTCSEEYSFEIVLDAPNHGFIHYLASERASIIPEGICEEMNDRFALEPLGTGPFQVERNECKLLVLRAHHTYFQGRAHLDQIELWVVAENEIEGKTVHMDGYDLRWGPKTAEETDWKSVSRQAVGCKMLLLNLKKSGLLQNSALRQALCAAIDREAFLETVGSGDVSPATNILADLKKSSDPEQKQDVAALLREAGYNGEGLQLYSYTFQQNEQEARWLARQWEEAGVKVEVNILPVQEFASAAYLEKADLILYYQVTDDNRELFLHEMYLSPKSLLSRYLSTELCETVRQQMPGIMQEAAAEKRIARLLALEDQLKQESAVYFLYHRHESATYHPALSGVTLNALGWVPFKDVWFQSRNDRIDSRENSPRLTELT